MSIRLPVRWGEKAIFFKLFYVEQIASSVTALCPPCFLAMTAWVRLFGKSLFSRCRQPIVFTGCR